MSGITKKSKRSFQKLKKCQRDWEKIKTENISKLSEFDSTNEWERLQKYK